MLGDSSLLARVVLQTMERMPARMNILRCKRQPGIISPHAVLFHDVRQSGKQEMLSMLAKQIWQHLPHQCGFVGWQCAFAQYTGETEFIKEKRYA